MRQSQGEYQQTEQRQAEIVAEYQGQKVADDPKENADEPLLRDLDLRGAFLEGVADHHEVVDVDHERVGAHQHEPSIRCKPATVRRQVAREVERLQVEPQLEEVCQREGRVTIIVL